MTCRTADIRNACLVGLSQAGKTQLTEALLHAGGSIPHCRNPFKLGECAQQNWRKLRGFKYLAKVIGVTFVDGEETDQPNQVAA